MVATAGARVVVNERPAGCSMCGGPVRVLKTVERGVATREHGMFRPNETVYVCAAGCHPPGRTHAIHRATSLTSRVLPGRTVGYDVMVRVGLLRYVEYRQRDEIRALLEAEGIRLSTGTISGLAHLFLIYLERLHLARADRLRAALDADGGWPMHVDATGEQGRGTLLVALAGWRRWVLGAWKIPTERADAILPRLQWVTRVFGAPCAAVRDLGHAVTEALDELMVWLGIIIPILACHFHFLRDIGGDLLKQRHDQLRELVRHWKIRTHLAALARELSRDLGPALAEAKESVVVWQEHVEQGHRLPEGVAGVACVRALAQWVLDFAADGQDDGFPFDRPYLDFYERGCKMRRAIDAYSRRPPATREVARALCRLGRILDPLRRDEKFTRAAVSLKMRVDLFEKLREALRLTPKTDSRTLARTVAPTVKQAAAELRDIRKAVLNLRRWLKANRPKRGPADDRRKAFDIILRHLQVHGRYLWGHEVRLSDKATGPARTRLVDRTNDIEEGWFHGMKHSERRRSGRKLLAQDMEQLPAAAALARNLRCKDYVELVCGSLDNLDKAFAELDRQKDLQPIDAERPDRTVHAPLDIDDLLSASLPRADRTLVRAQALETRILAAALSRAPAQVMSSSIQP